MAFTVDGPRGPAKVAQPGAVWLAGATRPRCGTAESDGLSHWTARSWDATQVPKPRATLAIAIGAPLHVPPELDAQALEAHREALQAALSGLEMRALQILQHPH